MTNHFELNLRMERLLGYNPANEVRPDTVGALSCEVRWSEEKRRRLDNKILNEGNSKVIGEYIYDFNTGEERFFRYQSRGMNKIKLEVLGTIKVDYKKNTIEEIK